MPAKNLPVEYFKYEWMFHCPWDGCRLHHFPYSPLFKMIQVPEGAHGKVFIVICYNMSSWLPTPLLDWLKLRKRKMILGRTYAKKGKIHYDIGFVRAKEASSNNSRVSFSRSPIKWAFTSLDSKLSTSNWHHQRQSVKISLKAFQRRCVFIPSWSLFVKFWSL